MKFHWHILVMCQWKHEMCFNFICSSCLRKCRMTRYSMSKTRECSNHSICYCQAKKDHTSRLWRYFSYSGFDYASLYILWKTKMRQFIGKIYPQRNGKKRIGIGKLKIQDMHTVKSIKNRVYTVYSLWFKLHCLDMSIVCTGRSWDDPWSQWAKQVLSTYVIVTMKDDQLTTFPSPRFYNLFWIFANIIQNLESRRIICV